MGVQISELQEDGMAAPAGLLNHAAASGQPLANARVSPMASSGSDANSNGGAKPSASGITANDFLKEVNAEDDAKQSLITHQLQLLMAQINARTISGNQ